MLMKFIACITSISSLLAVTSISSVAADSSTTTVEAQRKRDIAFFTRGFPKALYARLQGSAAEGVGKLGPRGYANLQGYLSGTNAVSSGSKSAAAVLPTKESCELAFVYDAELLKEVADCTLCKKMGLNLFDLSNLCVETAATKEAKHTVAELDFVLAYQQLVLKKLLTAPRKDLTNQPALAKTDPQCSDFVSRIVKGSEIESVEKQNLAIEHDNILLTKEYEELENDLTR
jgi:hypothetical protein